MTATTEKKKRGQRRALFSREEVLLLLKKQVDHCAASINGNMTEYTAKKKITETPLVEF